ncbi:hypothetical protein SKDZ_12G0470 [Saccharomyces kudriavzevii ZP591]|nr:hypothetical protein SKDZ_12G0470 [Saccharomyces kudriavzevii ZP591]
MGFISSILCCSSQTTQSTSNSAYRQQQSSSLNKNRSVKHSNTKSRARGAQQTNSPPSKTNSAATFSSTERSTGKSGISTNDNEKKKPTSPTAATTATATNNTAKVDKKVSKDDLYEEKYEVDEDEELDDEDNHRGRGTVREKGAVMKEVPKHHQQQQQQQQQGTIVRVSSDHLIQDMNLSRVSSSPQASETSNDADGDADDEDDDEKEEYIDLTLLQPDQYHAPGYTTLLPPQSESTKGKKCLILDLDETLVHSSFKYLRSADFVLPVEIDDQVHNVYVIKRPGVEEFLERVGKLFEVVVFTASVSRYGDPLLDILDTNKVIHHRLFREACYNYEGNYIKNLSQIGRPLSDIIILDNSPASYIFHPQHAIPISSWFSDTHDNELLDIIPLLEDLSVKTSLDVGKILDVTI